MKRAFLISVSTFLVFAPFAYSQTPAAGPSVTVYGDWPPTGACDQALTDTSGVLQAFAAPCNDKISAIKVPFGWSARLCEHDAAGGYGQCRTYLPMEGTFLGDMNDKATTFSTEHRMVGYLNSADYPVGIKVGYKYSSDGGSIEVGYDGTWIAQTYSVILPSGCKLQLSETTSTGDVEWSQSRSGNTLTLALKVKPRAPAGANHWVGVELQCR
jgi:hypothetical protein